MSHVHSPSRHDKTPTKYTKKQMKAIMKEQRWQYTHIGVSKEVLEDNFAFLNDAVVIRSSAEGIPLMTTTGIYGPIMPNTTVILKQDKNNVVFAAAGNDTNKKESLLNQLKQLKANTPAPKEGNSTIVQAKWVSGKDGGGLPSVGSSANVFGATGALLVNENEVDFPVIDYTNKDFDETLAFYGAKLIKPNTAFYMDFDKPLFGMEYDTQLPGYIKDYVMKPYGGGGLFVEHHPFPHIWFPNPDANTDGNICRILLGRIIESEEEQRIDNKNSKKENKCPERKGDIVKPKYHFTVFRIPSDGHAIAVDECCIHNDSFCKGKQVVFLANTDANTVALRETSPFKNLRITEKENPID